MAVAGVRRRTRAVARHAALDMAWMARRLAGGPAGLDLPSVHFVYLHSVPPAELGRFRTLVAALAKTHHLVSHSAAVSHLVAGDVTHRYLSFSFDDGFAGNVAAAGVLEEFGTTGCFFVPTGFVGCRTVSQARGFFGTAAGVDEPAMSWGDLETLKDRGHEVGNHTVHHRMLAGLSRSELVDEVCLAAEVLRARLGGCEHFAWPLGRFRHFGPRAARTAHESGHLSCASAERGAHGTGPGSGTSTTVLLRRDHLMTSWPLRHNLLFVERRRALYGPTDWPDNWLVDWSD